MNVLFDSTPDILTPFTDFEGTIDFHMIPFERKREGTHLEEILTQRILFTGIPHSSDRDDRRNFDILKDPLSFPHMSIRT